MVHSASMSRRRLGRPPEYAKPVRFLVTLEAGEYRRLQAASRVDRVSTTKWARNAILAALARRKET
jgi:hypothetical protein